MLLKLFAHGEEGRISTVLNQRFYEEVPVDLTLPKFTINSGTVNLNEQLTAMGLEDAFDPKVADLSKASKQSGLHLSAVIHKVILNVSQRREERSLKIY